MEEFIEKNSSSKPQSSNINDKIVGTKYVLRSLILLRARYTKRKTPLPVKNTVGVRFTPLYIHDKN